jgi:hypothetical protein
MRQGIWSLINLYKGHLNDPGKLPNAFSKGWWGRGTKPNERMMKAKMFAFFKRNVPTESTAADNMWSCFEANRDRMVGSGHAKRSWLACNARAVNKALAIGGESRG